MFCHPDLRRRRKKAAKYKGLATESESAEDEMPDICDKGFGNGRGKFGPGIFIL